MLVGSERLVAFSMGCLVAGLTTGSPQSKTTFTISKPIWLFQDCMDFTYMLDSIVESRSDQRNRINFSSTQNAGERDQI